MTITYNAKIGNGYYFNLRRRYGDMYIADCLHNTSVGWLVEEDMQVLIRPEHMVNPTKIYPRVFGIPANLMDGIEIRFPNAKIQEL